MGETCAKRVLLFLREGPASYGQILTKLDVDDETLRLCLGIMLRAGQIMRDERHADGAIVYMLPGELRAAAK